MSMMEALFGPAEAEVTDFNRNNSEGVNMGDGMGGGRNGRSWGAPIFGQNPGQHSFLPQKMQNQGAPKTAVPTTTHPIPHLTPSE